MSTEIYSEDFIAITT